MRILMLAEYFHPFDRGGSEWSTFYLAKGLREKGCKVAILTPNYGEKVYQKWRNIPIFRFWFPLKLSKKGQSVSPFWHTNILWFFHSFLSIWRLIKKNYFDVIHVQGKYFLPVAIIIGRLKKIPVIVTIRDYQILCPIGLCLGAKKGDKIYAFTNFVQKEIPQYLAKYHQSKNVVHKLILAIASIRAKMVSYFLSFSARKAEAVIATSNKMRQILSRNRIKSSVVYNSMIFDSKEGKKENLIVFVGRLTWGKGAHLLVPSLSNILEKKKKYQLIIIGDGFLKEEIRKQARKASIKERVIFKGHLPYRQTQDYLARAKIVICPSKWQEPFGRTALEALAHGTPVVVANRGGLPEIVEDDETGYVVEPKVRELEEAVGRTIKNNKKLRKNIEKKYEKLKDKFYHQPIDQYLKIYKKLVSQ